MGQPGPSRKKHYYAQALYCGVFRDGEYMGSCHTDYATRKMLKRQGFTTVLWEI